MKVRVKFKCDEVTKVNEGYTIKLSAVTTDKGEINIGGDNSLFFKWTPSGYFEMYTANLDAAKAFIVGNEYYIDFMDARPVSEQQY